MRRLDRRARPRPGQIQGTGAGGRITRNDVLRCIDAGRRGRRRGAGRHRAAPAPAQPAAPASRAAPRPRPGAGAREPVARAGERDTSVPLTNIRRRTGRAHGPLEGDVGPRATPRSRSTTRASSGCAAAHRGAWKAEEGFSLTYLPFITRAVVDAIREFPEVNATVGDDELIVHNYVNLGIAVDLDFKGLMVPVIHDADAKRLRAIAREISDLAGRARAKKLRPTRSRRHVHDHQPRPVRHVHHVADHQPAAGRDPLDRRREAAARWSSTCPTAARRIAIHSVGNLALAWDHRAFDGAYAVGVPRPGARRSSRPATGPQELA